MKQIVDELYQLDSFPPHAFNSYVMGNVLVDAGTRYATRRLLRQVRQLPIDAHALTHAHADHQGASAALCKRLGIPLLCGEGDADAMDSGAFATLVPLNPVTRLQLRWWAGPAHPVSRRLRAGDVVGGFTVLETPGHTPGHICFWREADRALLVGDVFFNRHPVTGRVGLHEPPDGFTLDPARNRESIHRLAELDPAVVCFGHGPPLRCRGGELAEFAAQLPGRPLRSQ